MMEYKNLPLSSLFQLQVVILLVTNSLVQSRYVANTMEAKKLLDQLGRKEFNSYFDTDFRVDSNPSLYELMYDGRQVDDWTRAASEVGVFLAKFRQDANKTNVKDASDGFGSASSLQDWLKQLGQSKEAYLNLIPDRIRNAYSENIEQILKRAAEATALLESGDYVCLQNALLKNIKLKDSQIRFDGNEIHARFGPDSLDASIFLSDILLMYYKQMGHLEHGVQYKTVDTAQKFGQALDEQNGKLGIKDEEKKRYWANVSLLTGWEVIRRFTTKDNVENSKSRRTRPSVRGRMRTSIDQ
jgi:hypothetical protein